MDGFFHFLGILVMCFTGLILAVMVLFILVMNMKSNPLKDVLTSLLWRLGATAGVAMVGVPVQPVPGVDVAYDLGGTLLLALYWLGFLRDVYLAVRGNRNPPESEMKTVHSIKGR